MNDERFVGARDRVWLSLIQLYKLQLVRTSLPRPFANSALKFAERYEKQESSKEKVT